MWFAVCSLSYLLFFVALFCCVRLLFVSCLCGLVLVLVCLLLFAYGFCWFCFIGGFALFCCALDCLFWCLVLSLFGCYLIVLVSYCLFMFVFGLFCVVFELFVYSVYCVYWFGCLRVFNMAVWMCCGYLLVFVCILFGFGGILLVLLFVINVLLLLFWFAYLCYGWFDYLCFAGVCLVLFVSFWCSFNSCDFAFACFILLVF